ncbi:tyrosine-type recombinase/integrase [Canibacter oris]|uniref:Integrase n=1 Tax=Canibacter oris TaxID=1365628 RepID=A0A840DEB3_9MICO|nr:tyrosine-type recombinase/integrase [Canibacter oris]MBB4071781.1 integrase [Canibacter oris]
MAQKRTGRGTGFGSVRKLKSGKYQARYTHPEDPSRRISAGTYTTVREARDTIAKIQLEISSGTWQDPAEAKTLEAQTLAALATEIITTGTNRYGEPLAIRTRNTLLGYWRKGLKQFADLTPDQLTPTDVRRWHIERAATAATAAGHEAQHLRSIYAQLIEEYGYTLKNPVPVNITRSKTGKQYQTITNEQFRHLIEHFNQLAPQLTLMPLLAALTGLRASEIRGLQRRNLIKTGDRYQIEINHQAIYDSATGRYIVDARTKTHGSTRTVTAPTQLTQHITRHLDTYTAKHPTAFLFAPQPRSNGKPNAQPVVSEKTFNRHWHKALLLAGIDHLENEHGEPVPYNPEDYTGGRTKGGKAKTAPKLKQIHNFRFHDLRALYVTTMAESGATAAETMAQTGHTNAETHHAYMRNRNHRAATLADTTAATLLEG